MHGRVKWCAVSAVVVVAAAGCGAGATHSNAKPAGVSAMRAIKADEPVLRTSSTAEPTPPKPSVPATPAPKMVAPAAPVTPAAPAPAPPAAPVTPTVTIVAVGDGTVKEDGVRECSNISAASLGTGEFEVRRTGPLDAPLDVQYSTTGADADHLPLPGVITIPAGAASASIGVEPKFPDQQGPVHIHRASALTVAITDGAAYDPGAPASAAITLHFDLDRYACPGGWHDS